jgi:hypothetical protein
MGHLVEEVREWNTPLIGGYLLWRFTHGYCANHPTGDAPVGLLHFIAMAVLSSPKLLGAISNHRDSLQSYLRFFEKEKSSDLLLAVHERTREKKEHTLESIEVAIATGLLFWDADTGKLYPRQQAKARRGNNLKPSVISDGDKAETLGKWFSAHDIQSVANYLKVIL